MLTILQNYCKIKLNTVVVLFSINAKSNTSRIKRILEGEKQSVVTFALLRNIFEIFAYTELDNR